MARTKKKAETVQYPMSTAIEKCVEAQKPKKVIGLKNASSEVGVNPKDRIGASKVDLTALPSTAMIAWALAQMDGGTKYGLYNWRIEPVQMRTYIGAAQRHLLAFLEGEEYAGDSGVKHLGHVMACAAIIIDAMYHDRAVDDRPVNQGVTADLINATNDWIKLNKPEGWGR